MNNDPSANESAPEKRFSLPGPVKEFLFILFVFVCFPVGLYLLWAKKKRYPLALRIGITLLVAAVVILSVSVAMPEDHTDKDDIEFVSVPQDSNVYGPSAPEVKDAVVSYKNAYSADTVLVAPAETPEPVYVWCNDMGKYYHIESCRYVKETTPKVTLQQAMVGGFTACPDCKPPKQ